MIKLGANSVLFGAFDYETAAKYISYCGYDGIEIAAIKGMCEHLDLDNWQEQADELLSINEKYGLEFVGMEEAALDEERLIKAFEAASELGIPVINVGSGGESDNEEELEKRIKLISNMAKKAAEYDVKLCAKPHVGASIYNTETVKKAANKIKTPGFGINFDPSHIYRAGENPEEAVPEFVDVIGHVHIRDCEGRDQGPGKPQQQVSGRGSIDLFGFCEALVKGGYEGALSLELIGANVVNKDDEWADDTGGKFGLEEVVALAAENYGYLNACLKKLGAR